MIRKLILQLLADAGTLVNATGNYVNAYTGAVTAFAGNNTLAPELKTFYDTELLENARAETYYAQFAKKQPLPAGRGKTVEWRKWNTFARADKLQEGVIPQGQKFGTTTLTGSIDQFGTYASISDQLELHAFDDVILGASEEMGASMAETQERLIRDNLLTGTNVLYCDNINGSTYVSTPTDQFGMRYVSGTATCLLTPDMVNKAVTKLKKDRVPTINGKYYAVIHPSVAYDLRSSSEWIDAHKYAHPDEIYNGEIGELHGVRFIEDAFAPVLVGANLNGSTARFLSVTAYASNGTPGTALTDSGDAGETSAYFVTVSETPDGPALLGRVVNVIDATNATVEASCTNNGTVEIVGVDASSKYIYFDKAPGTSPANGDFLQPGEGAREAKGSTQNAAYATFFFGKDSFGIIDPEGGAAEMIIHDKAEVGGPLNQFSTVGYKLETNGATILYPERILRVMSCSAYSATDSTNVYD